MIIKVHSNKQVPARVKRESGVKPERSRHCNRERCCKVPLPPGGKAQQAMTGSQETCLFVLCNMPSEEGNVHISYFLRQRVLRFFILGRKKR